MSSALNERKDLRVEGDPRSHPVWRDDDAALQLRPRGWLGMARRDRQARARAAHLDRGRRWSS